MPKKSTIQHYEMLSKREHEKIMAAQTYQELGELAYEYVHDWIYIADPSPELGEHFLRVFDYLNQRGSSLYNNPTPERIREREEVIREAIKSGLVTEGEQTAV